MAHSAERDVEGAEPPVRSPMTRRSLEASDCSAPPNPSYVSDESTFLKEVFRQMELRTQ